MEKHYLHFDFGALDDDDNDLLSIEDASLAIGVIPTASTDEATDMPIENVVQHPDV